MKAVRLMEVVYRVGYWNLSLLAVALVALAFLIIFTWTGWPRSKVVQTIIDVVLFVTVALIIIMM